MTFLKKTKQKKNNLITEYRKLFRECTKIHLISTHRGNSKEEQRRVVTPEMKDCFDCNSCKSFCSDMTHVSVSSFS